MYLCQMYIAFFLFLLHVITLHRISLRDLNLYTKNAMDAKVYNTNKVLTMN